MTMNFVKPFPIGGPVLPPPKQDPAGHPIRPYPIGGPVLPRPKPDPEFGPWRLVENAKNSFLPPLQRLYDQFVNNK